MQGDEEKLSKIILEGEFGTLSNLQLVEQCYLIAQGLVSATGDKQLMQLLHDLLVERLLCIRLRLSE